ncbi:hypothetical protein JW756_06160 [Candidatus Woesearchaeota archaeon]|nr:hypothetical protein [Candidatus Woesearchaeota archaeon]
MPKKRNIPEPTEEELRKVGDAANEKGWSIVRSTLVKAVLGERFYQRHCLGKERMIAFVKKIKFTDPTLYGHLEYTAVEKGPRDVKRLSPEEENIFTEVLCRKSEENDWGHDNPPKNVVHAIKNKLEEHGYKRRESSISYHASAIWQGYYKNFNGIMPNRLLMARERKISSQIIRRIESKAKLLEQKNKDLETILGEGNSRERSKKRKEYLTIASRGHQALIAYLMESKNYKRILVEEAGLGNDLKLISVDFTESNTPCDLYNKYKRKAKLLERRCKEDAEMIAFVDGWMRCDMIFKRNDAYFVVEVKQNAVNHEKDAEGKEGFPNATKAVQQLGAYIGGLRETLKLKNSELPEEQKFPEKVFGILVAYTIDPKLQEYFKKSPDLIKTITIPKEEVMQAVREDQNAYSRRGRKDLIQNQSE